MFILALMAGILLVATLLSTGQVLYYRNHTNQRGMALVMMIASLLFGTMLIYCLMYIDLILTAAMFSIKTSGIAI